MNYKMQAVMLDMKSMKDIVAYCNIEQSITVSS